MNFFSKAYNEDELKIRFRHLLVGIDNHTNECKHFSLEKKRQIKDLLQQTEISDAEIEAKFLVSADMKIEGYKIFRSICESIADNLRIITSNKECPVELREGISSRSCMGFGAKA